MIYHLTISIEDDLTLEEAQQLLAEMEEVAAKKGYSIYDQNLELGD